MLSSPQDVYARNLLPLNRGYPLWMPEPSDQLLICRRGGIRIGDVGVVVPENGSFDVFFNICLPRDDPFHKDSGVPKDFDPIVLHPGDLEDFPDADRPGCIIASPSVRKEKASKALPEDECLSRFLSWLSIVFDHADVTSRRMTTDFKLTSNEGAILILPAGADSCNLRDKTRFREMAIQHGAEWYKFAKDHLRRLMRSDSLFLITGYNNARSCSLAAFEGAEGHTARFTIQNIGGHDHCSWHSKCPLEWRNGRVNNEDSETPNQTVFIQGFRIELKSGFLAKAVSVTMDPPISTREREYPRSSRSPSQLVGRRDSVSLIRDTTDGTVHVERLSRQSSLDSIYDPNAVDLTGSITLESEGAVACGAYADIYKGTCWVRNETVKVAIKVVKFYLIHDCKPSTLEKRLRREIKVWSRVDHANVLRLIGTTSSFGPFLAMVCPWAENGTLTSFLNCPSRKLKTAQKLTLLHDTASGLHYLHSESIVHGDLSGNNILVDVNGRALLADFGLSILLEELSQTISQVERGTPRWAAPESLGLHTDSGAGNADDADRPKHIPMMQSDIYAFGSIMLQIFSGKAPYHYYNKWQVMVALSQGETPTRPNDPLVTDRRWEFIQRCWSPFKKIELRPSSKDVVEFSRGELTEDMSTEEWVNVENHFVNEDDHTYM